jgi:hypothetical protein
VVETLAERRSAHAARARSAQPQIGEQLQIERVAVDARRIADPW